MAFKTDQIKLKEDYANDGAAGAPADGTLALIGATGSKELKIRDDGAWVAISGSGGGAENLVELNDVASGPSTEHTVGVVNGAGKLQFAKLSVNNIHVDSVNTSGEWGNDDTTLATTAAIQDWVEGQSYFSAETFTEVSQDSTPVLGGDLVTDGNKIVHATGGNSSELTFTHTWNGETNHTHLASVKSIDLYLDQNSGDTGQAIRVYNDLNPNVHAPDDTNYIWKLHESGTMYMKNAIDMGTNTITDAKVAQWDSAYTSITSGGYITQQSDIKTSLSEDYNVPDNVGQNIIAITGDPSTYKFIFTKSNLGNWSETGQQKVEIINASTFTQTIDGDGGATPAQFYLINTGTSGLGSITIDPHQKATIIPNMSDNSGLHFVLLSSI